MTSSLWIVAFGPQHSCVRVADDCLETVADSDSQRSDPMSFMTSSNISAGDSGGIAREPFMPRRLCPTTANGVVFEDR